MEILDETVSEEGPFTAILGFSQGAATVLVYLGHSQKDYGEQPFERAVMISGYIERTHEGIYDELIEGQSPYGGVPSLHWIGLNDNVITPSQSYRASKMFTDPYLVVDEAGAHEVPTKGTSGFDDIVAFLRGDACQDTTVFYERDPKKSCAWVREDLTERCSLVWTGKPLSEYCLKSCGTCTD